MNVNDLIRTFALANDFKEGDLSVGGTRDDQLREEARKQLESLSIGEIAHAEFVDDQVTETVHRSVDPELEEELAHLTIADLKRSLLAPDSVAWMRRYCDGLASEVIAAVAKVMSNDELGLVSRALFNPLPGDEVAVGARQHFGSRIQPNSPGDDPDEILFSILEGLTYGCGDVIIGLNPASDDLDTIVRLEELLCSVVKRLDLPTRYSVLSDIVKQSSARERTRVDVGFQSLAGTSKALRGMVGLDVDGLLELARGFEGLYFETGQGSEVTNQAAEGIDMVTLEARAYGVARYLRRQTGAWTIVNDVAGFIGPEVFRTGNQLLRACLEDTMMAKLHGITMGLDVCATFHMGINPQELQKLTEQVVDCAAPAYLMAVAGNADPMLGYLTTSFREHPRIRRRIGRQISSAMKRRLVALGVMGESGEAGGRGAESLYGIYQKAGGDMRTLDALREEGARKILDLAERGFDLGAERGTNPSAGDEVSPRIRAIYDHARRALYARLDDSLLRETCPRHLRVRTKASARDDYLAHPPAGEQICAQDAARVIRLYPERRPRVQVVISDGLNANASNENLRGVLPPLRQQLVQAGHLVSDVEIVIENGRVRAGYHVGLLLDVEMIVHFIGERPGTGIDTLSTYITYGRDAAGRSRWNTHFDHSWTTAVCGIHDRGKRPEAAAEEIARLVNRIFEQHCSGVELR
ncbi:MAG TPA: ethanolamine ammonia-lyase subunit EutB [Blastocatellia bacterium]|nr:ethanolamine ammonia-lyase subunit EutB [Blastocatellia bacterium]